LFGGFLRIETDASAVIIKRIVDAYRAKVCTLAESGCFMVGTCTLMNKETFMPFSPLKKF
jgi:hypothetical protein